MKMGTKQQISENYDLFGASDQGPDNETLPYDGNPFGVVDSCILIFQPVHQANSPWTDAERPNAYYTYATMILEAIVGACWEKY